MNEARIADAAATIGNRKLALAWLEEHGRTLDPRNHSDFAVEFRMHRAGGCPGVVEAAHMLESYARLALPDILKAAIECCRNDIAIATAAIREELDR